MRLLVLAPGRLDTPVSPQMIRAAASAGNCRHAYDSLSAAVKGSRWVLGRPQSGFFSSFLGFT